MKMSEVVAKYIQLRDKKDEYRAEYNAKVAKIDEAMGKIECKLLEAFAAAGVDNMKTEAGTAYISNKTSVTVGDREAFMEYVQNNNEWPLLEVKPSKTAVVEFRQTHDDLPPGINWRVEKTVSIRRS